MASISNKLNYITTDPQNPNRLIKTGPPKSIESEAYALTTLAHTELVPKVFEVTEGKIIMEYLPGITISELYSKGLLTIEIFESILDKIEIIHGLSIASDEHINTSTVTSWLQEKFKIRTNMCNRLECNYMKHDDTHCCNSCKNGKGHCPTCNCIIPNISSELLTWLKSYSVSHICPSHGDPWLANIMYDMNKNTITFIDPRGSCCDTNTILNDKNYDYAKILQSILGYDKAIFNYDIDDVNLQVKLLDSYKRHITKKGMNFNTLMFYAQMLMHGSQPFVPCTQAKNRIEKLLSNISLSLLYRD